MLGQLEEIQTIGLNQRGFIRRDSLIALLTTNRVILSTFLLVLEEGYAQAAHLLQELLNWHLQSCCITLIGSFQME